ncbi:acetyltransferase [Litorimonas sp. WD9-15]|uniref:acetyltransferase n=1 Tax=Litorimonas sp. WD9-15 TaxID=3418716 RepID=UPI003D057F5B
MSKDHPLFIIGAGGHAKVVANAALKAGLNLEGFLSDSADDIGKTIFNLPVRDRQSALKRIAAFHVAIGSNNIRAHLSEEMVKAGWVCETIIHPSAAIGCDVKIGTGTFIGPQAVLNPGAVLGNYCIINSGAIVEHDCQIAEAVHLSPRVALGGHVAIGENSWVGIGATVRDRAKIGAEVMIGAGAVVVSDIDGPGTAYGVPAKLRPC